MRLKILIVPFFLMMTLILIIGYIKPGFDGILARKASITEQELLIAKVDSTAGNVTSLGSFLDQEKNNEDFLFQYLPSTMTQDQIINTFNYLASDAGLIVTDMDLKKIVETVVVSVPEGASTPVEASASSKVKTFQFTGSVLGSYENIKKFFASVTHMNRFQKMQLFSIQKNDQSSTGSTTDLKGIFSADFGYLPDKSVASALGLTLFDKSQFDLSSLKKFQEKIMSAPTLEKSTLGRPNPFQ